MADDNAAGGTDKGEKPNSEIEETVVDNPADAEESGAGYGNHGDVGQGNTAGAGQSGQSGISGGMSDCDRG